jgi:hypothetical protein
LDPRIEEQLATNRLYAAISSRPGQSGRADGYVLEGPELEFYLKKLAKKGSVKTASASITTTTTTAAAATTTTTAPAAKQAAAKQPAAKQPAAKQPAAKQPAAKQ